MTTIWAKRALIALSAAFLGLSSQAAFAAVQIQPFLCAQSGDGSNAGWVTVQNKRVIGVTVQRVGDSGGGKFVGLSGVPGNSVVTVGTIKNSLSANVDMKLTLTTSANQTLTVNPTSSAGTNYTFTLANYGLTSKVQITALAVFAQNITGSPGSIFLAEFVLNGKNETNQLNSISGCPSALGEPPPPNKGKFWPSPANNH